MVMKHIKVLGIGCANYQNDRHAQNLHIVPVYRRLLPLANG